jgi:serine/threonine-protein kinase/endoribonuclease IRE1
VRGNAQMLFRLLLLAHAALAHVVSLNPAPAPTHTALVEHRTPYQHTHPVRDHSDAHLDDLELLDIVLLASVDGKLHALNRTSGETLWSMTPSSHSSSSGPAALSPLVRTDHVDYDPEVTDDNSQAAYIIEPQSGDIYVMPNPSSPLQRFPFSMQELVDMSPFSFRGENDSRVFVGKKETSLLVVELQTGKIKATLNSECPWDQFDHFKDELDLDELEESVPPKAPPSEVYIGRTGMVFPPFFDPCLNP